MTLTPEEKNAIINVRIEKSDLALKDTKGCIKMEMWTAAANRLYYACYNMVSALLLKQGFETHTHKGVITLFSMNFIKPGIITKELGKTYNNIFELRQTGDYDDWRIIEKEDIVPLIKPAEEFIDKIKELLKE